MIEPVDTPQVLSIREKLSGVQPTVVDLFCGAGGLSEGFRSAGFDVLGGCEIDPDAAATFELNFPDAVVVRGDIREERAQDAIREVAAEATVVVGGPPCQAFSQVRNHSRLIDDPRNSLYREFVKVIALSRPKAFLMENVTGIDQLGVREEILSDLGLDGEYRVRAQVVDAADHGVPQTRRRLLFVGLRSSDGVEIPEMSGTGATEHLQLVRVGGRRPSYAVGAQQDILNSPAMDLLTDDWNDQIVSAWQAISDLEGLRLGNRADAMLYDELPGPLSAFQQAMRYGAEAAITNVQVPRMNEDTQMRLRQIPAGGNFRDLPEKYAKRYLSGQRWGQHNGSGELSRKHYYAYRRLHPDLWAWTLNTKADSAYHYDAVRALSVREFARLQSFPDRFRFTTDSRKGAIPHRIPGGPAHSRYRQVGNAVPPRLAKAAAKAILEVVGSQYTTSRATRSA